MRLASTTWTFFIRETTFSECNIFHNHFLESMRNKYGTEVYVTKNDAICKAENAHCNVKLTKEANTTGKT